MEEQLKQEPTDLIKIVLFGPESTGKTTLAKALAAHYNTEWVPEYAREYLQDKWDREQKTCEPHDLLPIAVGQMQMENQLAKRANEILFCDTDLLETKVYSEAYYVGNCDPVLEKYALQNTYDLYLLTDIDIPWEKDDLRDKPDAREEMFAFFHDTLKKYNRNFLILNGNKEERLKKAITHIEKLQKPMIDFTDKDIAQLKEKGIPREKVLRQIETFKEGIPFVHLEKAAVINDGIVRVEDEEAMITYFERNIGDKTILKFVPASGAASRMFKAMFNFVDAYDPAKENLGAYVERTGDTAVQQFLAAMDKFSFHDTIMSRIAGRYTNEGEKAYAFIKEMLTQEGLNYGFYPKGLLPFHKCKHGGATPFKEHLKEGARYAKTNGTAHLHFTISPQHDAMFKKEEGVSVPRISQKTDTVFKVSYSYQKSSTDTLAVALDNQPFRNSDGSLLFRPGGHGALIENLNDQDADIIFIKNIDNVVVDQNLDAVADSKKMLGGLLLKVQHKAFEYARKLEGTSVSEALLKEAKQFVENQLNARFTADFNGTTLEQQVIMVLSKLNRPIRVCGMVKNEGEPGGGPFWVNDFQGNRSLQIVESAQMDMDNTEQIAILKNATHFNPVDLVCAVKDHQGKKYDLLEFVDVKQGFITEKTKEGQSLKALELPGLWNGAMAYWNTIFVEVPLVTFNPVKTVNDLLKPSHQA